MGDRLTRRTLDAWLKAGDNGPWLWCGEQRRFDAHRRGTGTASFVVQFRVGRGRPDGKEPIHRKRIAEATVHGESGTSLAVARATWIEVDRKAQLGRV